MSNNQLKIKSVTSVSNTIKQLEYLIETLKKGSLTIISHKKALILEPQDPIRFDMEAEIKTQKSDSHQKLSAKFKWRRKPDSWPSMIHAPKDNPINNKTLNGVCVQPEDIVEPQQAIRANISDKKQQIKLSHKNTHSRNKLPRENQSRNTASTQKRKTSS